MPSTNNKGSIAQLRSRMANSTRRQMTPNNIAKAERAKLLQQGKRNLFNPLSHGQLLHISRRLRKRKTRKNL